MNRLLITLPLLTASVVALAGGQASVGKLGQATEATAVYSRPSTHSRMYYRLSAYDYLIIKHSNDSNWDRVLLKNGNYAYTPAYVVAELPYTVTRKQPQYSAPSRSGPTSSRGAGYDMAAYALNFRGTPYEWGGDDLRNGIDCSGFVKKMAGTVGENLPRTAAEQATVGQPITRLEDLQAGDRLYFKLRSETRISHTGIYLGGGMFIHSSHGRGGVAAEPLSMAWRRMLVAARR